MMPEVCGLLVFPCSTVCPRLRLSGAPLFSLLSQAPVVVDASSQHLGCYKSLQIGHQCKCQVVADDLLADDTEFHYTGGVLWQEGTLCGLVFSPPALTELASTPTHLV